ncbi:hypothetical protein MJO28_012243 [Puccinia striiformis f. sp. tritici]|uniref:Uncharacterized protein n=2 Tax=Puccinia striiformis f. sp. tritici TaxID=168172 RepID=A0A0L0UW82_9BASI|nr:hypothetical protein Pst134EA_022879 [Puccinia striiformis f. sp. tritici]KAI9611837.1 hypothetical protein KEM48_004344 [Puccinia striiformis f. sp. tritici PST-130]KNE91313.1 hypothetical protein PSTG_15244 [Puccinia striiformis f. sp. tritici PST-78]KAH9445916.1 hypothetical protein Pst134EB_023745 [Puccinia striiformis f. sp. tritici]KAH9455411.1 hypothetical protein Pst134EA_022879 [Puccinia striiformis f. sp. tritici]KAI7942216.1 hypothetical protein MJO28_012243 [Puccinia striiformis
MEDPARNDEDSDASTYSSSESEQEQQQGDLVVQGFASLCKNYNPGKYHVECKRAHRWAKGEGFQPHELDLRKAFLNQLRSSLLPLLREQTNSLSELLDPSRLQIDPEPTLELILDTQSELDTTLHQIEDALNNLHYKSDPLVKSSEREDDGHFKEFKGFRMFGLDNRFRGLLHPTTSLFEQSQKLIRQLELSTEESQSTSSNISDSEEVQSPPINIALTRKQIINSACCSSNAAESMIEWIQRSDIQLLQHFWTSHLRRIDSGMEQLLKLISLPDDSEGDDGLSDDHITPPSELTIQLAYQVLPTIKLSRLFCKKIITNGLNSKRCPLCTDLSSKQLTDLSDLSGEVATLVSFLVGQLKMFRYRFAIPGAIDSLWHATHMLKRWLKSQVPCLSLHLIPLVLDTDSFSAQDHLKDWLMIWSTQVNVAIQNFQDAIDLYVKNRDSSIADGQ